MLSILRRVLTIAGILILVNFISFSYASISLHAQQALNPFGARQAPFPQIFDLYAKYGASLLRGDLGDMPGALGKISSIIGQAAIASLGLLLIAFTLSTLLGLGFGLVAVRNEPAGVRSLLTPLASLGLAMPGFFLAAIFLALIVSSLIHSPPDAVPFLPTGGFGWDAHLVLPVLALVIRPSAQIAQATASLLAGELNKQYVTAARAFGTGWRHIRRRDALKNILAPVILTISSSFRLMIAELVLVEFIFNWPGLGRFLARTLIPPSTATQGGFGLQDVIYLHPPLLAALMTAFGLLFLTADLLATTAAQRLDPRLGAGNEMEEMHAWE